KEGHAAEAIVFAQDVESGPRSAHAGRTARHATERRSSSCAECPRVHAGSSQGRFGRADIFAAPGAKSLIHIPLQPGFQPNVECGGLPPHLRLQPYRPSLSTPRAWSPSTTPSSHGFPLRTAPNCCCRKATRSPNRNESPSPVSPQLL